MTHDEPRRDPSTPSGATTPADHGLADDDPRLALAGAVAIAGSVIGAVRPDQLDLPTPCDAFDVRDLIGHLVGVLRRLAVVGRRGDLSSVPDVVDGVDDAAWLAAWTDAAHDLQAAWTDDALLGETVTLPWAEMPGAVALSIYVNEVTVHTWDLATATGQSPDWDHDVLAVAQAAIEASLPAEGRTEMFDAMWEELPAELAALPHPFAAAVPVPPEAPAIDRLVAFNGRRP